MRRRDARRVVVPVAVALVVLVAVGVAARPPATTAPSWQVAIGPDPVAMVVDQPAGRLYVMDHLDGVLRVVDTATGALAQRVALGGGGPLAVDAGSGHLFVASAWNGPDRNGVYTDHAVVRVFDGRSGALVRTIGLGVEEDVLALLAAGAQRGSGGGSGRVVALCASVALVLDARSGAVLRRIRAGATLYSAQAALDPATGRAFVLASDARSLDVLDLGRGTKLRTVVLGGYLSGIAVDRRAGRVVVADAAHSQLRLLDEHTMRVVKSVPIGGPPAALAVDERNGRIVVTAADARAHGSVRGAGRAGGRVLVLDGRMGAILRTIPVNGTPVLAAVDARTAHLFVATIGAIVAETPGPWDRLPSWLRRWLPWVRQPARPAGTLNMMETINTAG